MLTRLRLRNLKIWGDQLWDPGVELAPITLLLGPNSAGKTSIVQLPLLLKQTFESPDRHLDLNMGGQATDLVDLGSYESVVHGHDTEREIGVGLTLHDALDRDVPDLAYAATYLHRRSGPALKRMEIDCAGELFAAERQGAGGYLLSAPGYVPRQFSNRADAKRSFQPERSIAFSPDAVAEIGGSAGAKVQDLSLRVRQELGSLAYLGPLREKPGRSYFWGGGEPGDLGARGERAVDALLASANTRKRQKAGEEGGKEWLVSKVSDWLRELGVADSLELERQGSRHYEVIVVRGKQRANIMDVGFGVSQVLPMVVLAFFVPRGTTIIAEQPEIHLHPRAQVGLAELMVAVAKKRKVQFLVETHSEHLFRRLQTLIAERKLEPRDCKLYFVDKDGAGEARIDHLQVDEYGRVANWPRHFFGDALGETERQTRKMLQRLAKEQGTG